jgi:hypothetical protein
MFEGCRVFRYTWVSVMCAPLLLLTLLLTPSICSAQNAESGTVLFQAGAFGSYAFVGQTVTLGKTAPVGVGTGCGTTQVGASTTGTVASVTLPPLILTGAIDTTAESAASDATASADAHDINLLADLVKADEVKSVSTTSRDGTTLVSSAAGSNVVNLVVNGKSISGTPAPNTDIALPGLGHVVLNEQSTSSNHDSAGLTVNMIHVYITVQNALGIAVGSQVIVAHANSGLAVAGGPAALDGTAFGTRVNVANIIHSSATAPASVPCLGTDGVVRTNSVAGVNVVPELVSGTITDTAQGSITSSSAASDTSSAVQSVNLLNGLITADAVKADAAAETSNGTSFDFSDSGSSFLHLKVSGHSEINDNVTANTQVDIAGVGTLWLHRVIRSSNHIEVRMIELEVTQTNVLNVPIGSDIRVADAEASLHGKSNP